MKKTMWLKLIAMTLCTIMMLSCLAGCGDDKVTIDGTPTIKMYIPSLNIANAQNVIDEIGKVTKEDVVACAKATELDTTFFLKGTLTDGGEEE